MIISAARILELNDEHNLLENLSRGQLENPEGTGIDLRVGKVNRLRGGSFLGADIETEEKIQKGKRHSPETYLIGNVKMPGKDSIVISPGEYLLVTTMEIVHSPKHKIKYDKDFPEGYLIPKIYPRSSLQRGGVVLHATNTSPGYKGELTFGLSNLGGENFTFELGARMFNVEYEAVIGDLKRPYEGQHQGGRITSGGKTEEQT
jgi:deoxycytidine triphosphate deaminase|tara:strand:+ start:391 stop:1002 length:612 start_codon:yes stop_codon:yes gene_type:complete